jgi:hypothetical protein
MHWVVAARFCASAASVNLPVAQLVHTFAAPIADEWYLPAAQSLVKHVPWPVWSWYSELPQATHAVPAVDFLPTPHLVQLTVEAALARTALSSPAAQLAQVPWPVWSWYVPAEQSPHAWPATPLAWPAGHIVQGTAPPVCFPMAQFVHAVRPVWSANVCVRHAVHDVWPVWSCAVPTAHEMHVAPVVAVDPVAEPTAL